MGRQFISSGEVGVPEMNTPWSPAAQRSNHFLQKNTLYYHCTVGDMVYHEPSVSQFLTHIQSLGRLGRGISPSRGRYLHRTTQNKSKNPCLK